MDRTIENIRFFVQLARRCHRDMRAYRSMPTVVAHNKGQRFAFLLVARHLHSSYGARVRNAGKRLRRAA
jgi:hypothetical protein